MSGPVAPNPLHAAARETMAVAREAKSPQLERVAVWAMIGSAITGMAVAAMHALHLLRKDWRDELREQERRRHDPAPPPDRPADDGRGAAATSHAQPDRDDRDDRKWTRRQEHHGHAHARCR